MTSIMLHDVRCAFRLLRGRASFGWPVVITIAAASGFLGIAANLATAVLSPSAGSAGPLSLAAISAAVTRGATADDDPLAALIPVAIVLLLAGAMVLAAACASLATLAMSHYRTRLGEFAIRASVGGTPRQLVQQLYTEGLLLSAAACALGGVFAFWSRQLLFSWLSPEQAALVEDGMSAGATIAASAVSLAACGVVFFACARAAAGLGLPLLFSEGDRLSATVKGARPRRGLVVVQVAIACALLIAATMLPVGLNRTLQTGPGVTADHVAAIHVIAPTRYADYGRPGRRFQHQALERAARVPGVQSVSWTSTLPLVSASRGGYATKREGPFVPLDTIQVSSRYFATMQHAVVEGREFDDRNDTVRADAAVINQPLADALFPAGAVGRTLIGEDGKQLQIIGVVTAARYRKMSEPVRPTVYLPMSTLYLSGLHLVARTSGDASRLVPAIAAALQTIDNPEIPRATSLDGHLRTAVRRDRIAMVFVAACAVLILLFAITGPYLLTRHAVTSRYDELAVRLAFGARGGHLFGLVLGQAARATVAGVVIGEAAALALAAAFAGATGVTAIAAAQVALAIGAALSIACALSAAVPAFRAYRLSPAAALR